MTATSRTLAPVAEIFEPVAAYLKLTTNVPSYFGDKTGNRAAVRWDWEPTGGSFEGASRANDYPRSLHDVRFGVDIYCRAQSFDAAWQMLEQVITALLEKSGHAYEIGGWQWADGSGESSTQKHSIVLSVSFVLPVFEHALDRAGYEPVTILAVGFDTSNTADPDVTLLTPKD